MLEKRAKEIEAQFNSGQQIFFRKSVEVLLARIQQLEIASDPTPAAPDVSKCRYCGNPMPKNEIRCKVCHP